MERLLPGSRSLPPRPKIGPGRAPTPGRSLAILALILTFAACHDADPVAVAPDALEDPAPAFRDDPGAEPFKVMTRNVYLGGNTGLVFAADFSNPLDVIQRAATVWGQVRASDIPSRAAAIAGEIDAAHPHVVSVQEAFRFESTSGVVIDWIDALEGEMELRGMPYRVETVQPGTEAVLPVSPSELVRFTDRIAVLVRDDVPTVSVESGTYQAALPLVVGHPIIGDVIVERAWIRFGTERGGVPHHVVATHLETQGIRTIHDLQGAELRASVAAGLDGVTFIAGDLNSDAAAGELSPSWTPTYGDLVDAGFQDAWLRSAASRRGDGYTCCHADDLRNASSELDQRLDFVLVKVAGPQSGSAGLPGAVAVDVVGDELGDRLASGLWPSDHAGVVAAVRLPLGLTGASR